MVAQPVMTPHSEPIRLKGGFADDSPVGGLVTDWLQTGDARGRREKRYMQEEQADEFMSKNYSTWVQGLSDHQREALLHYTSGSTQTNIELRTRSNEMTDEQRARIGHTDAAIRSARLAHPMDVYRGMSDTAKAEYQRKGWLNKGAVFDDLAFTSTSMTPYTPINNYSDENGVVVRVRLREGQATGMIGNRGTYGRDGGLTTHEETEVLLPRGTKYRVLDSALVEGPGGTRHVIDVEVIDE